MVELFFLANMIYLQIIYCINRKYTRMPLNDGDRLSYLISTQNHLYCKGETWQPSIVQKFNTMSIWTLLPLYLQCIKKLCSLLSTLQSFSSCNQLLRNFYASSISSLGQDPVVGNAKKDKKNIIFALCTRNGSHRVLYVKHNQGILGMKGLESPLQLMLYYYVLLYLKWFNASNGCEFKVNLKFISI